MLCWGDNAKFMETSIFTQHPFVRQVWSATHTQRGMVIGTLANPITNVPSASTVGSRSITRRAFCGLPSSCRTRKHVLRVSSVAQQSVDTTAERNTQGSAFVQRQPVSTGTDAYAADHNTPVPKDVLLEFEHKLEADLKTVGVTLTAVTGVIVFWRGVWSLLDYIMGDSLFGDVCCIVAGLAIVLWIRLSGVKVASTFWPPS